MNDTQIPAIIGMKSYCPQVQKVQPTWNASFQSWQCVLCAQPEYITRDDRAGLLNQCECFDIRFQRDCFRYDGYWLFKVLHYMTLKCSTFWNYFKLITMYCNLFKITFQQCPVLSPLRESPLQCKEPSKSQDTCILKWLGYNSTFAEHIYWFSQISDILKNFRKVGLPMSTLNLNLQKKRKKKTSNRLVLLHWDCHY